MRIRAQHAVCEIQPAADSLCQRVGPAEHGKAARRRRIEEHGSAHRQQESRSVSAALTGRGSQVSRCAVPDAYTFAADAHGLSRLRLSRPRHDGLDQYVSMFAPCLLGCPGTHRQHPVSAAPCGYRATAQNGSSRHVLACFDSSSNRRIECRSGLLIRGFGVRVPGGAPVLSWGFIAPGHFLRIRFVPMFAPCLLARTDPAIRALSKTARPASDAGARAAEPRRLVRRRRLGLLDQWSRPFTQVLGGCPEAPIPMPSRSVRPAGDRHSYGG
jgi:hypothetical protein